MKTKRITTIVTAASVIWLSVGCSKKVIKPESYFDTVVSHYDQGMRELEAGRLDQAHWEFERGTGLDRNDPLPYVGLALVETERGERDKAMDYTKKALKRDDKCVPAYLVRARVRVAFRKDSDWYKDALKDIEKAREIDPQNGEVPFREGQVHEAALQLGAAENSFSEVLELKSGFEAQANHEMEIISKIKRAAPGTDIGIKIGFVEEISRAETAVLFVEELKLLDLLERRRTPEYDLSYKTPDDPAGLKTEKEPMTRDATDLDEHWARNYVESVVKIGVNGLAVYPDDMFRPDELLTRGEYAMMLEDLLIKLLGDEELATKFVGQPSPFPDVRPDHATFNAINVCVDKGIMHADLKNNTFRPNDTVSGSDALLMIKVLQDELRTVF